MRCRLCAAPALPFERATVLREHDVQYFSCPQCGLLFTEAPWWLDQAYGQPIALADIGYVSRNVALAATTSLVLRAFFEPAATFLDYGAGYGMLVRLMRDRGFDFRWHDPHTENLFARGFAVDLLDAPRFELVTAFEVLEHLPEPLEDIATLAGLADHVLFTTDLVPEPVPHVQDWWYYGLDAGQHVALYGRRTLEWIAARFGRRLVSNGRNVHLLTKRRVPQRLFALLTRPRVARLLDVLVPGRSLQAEDFERVTGKRLR